MAQLDGYRTGGTLHIVINNQVGFITTSMLVQVPIVQMLVKQR